MHITERQPGDLARLRKLAAREKNAEQKDRLMAAALAVEQIQTSDIQRSLCRSRGFVQRWAWAQVAGQTGNVCNSHSTRSVLGAQHV